jgi:hypothetical protein
MRLAPIAALMIAGMTVSAAAQFLAPGLPPPGAAPPPQQQQLPPCFKDFAPLRAEAEKRGLVLKAGIEKKVSREEACVLFKRYSEAEAKVVKFVQTNGFTCNIPAEAATSMKANHARTLKTQNQVCAVGTAGPPRPTGPGLSEALGTTRSPGGSIDPLAPQSGTLDTLTGNVLSR